MQQLDGRLESVEVSVAEFGDKVKEGLQQTDGYGE